LIHVRTDQPLLRILLTRDLVQDVRPAKDIIEDMVAEAKTCLESGAQRVAGGTRAKL
jgi:hypothetical protein